MKIDKKEKYTLITSNESSFKDFYAEFSSHKSDFENENLIVLLLDSYNTKNNEVSMFLDYADEKKDNGTSFVIVDTNVDIDDFPETFNITPTLQEAEDVIDMETIERELGF